MKVTNDWETWETQSKSVMGSSESQCKFCSRIPRRLRCWKHPVPLEICVKKMLKLEGCLNLVWEEVVAPDLLPSFRWLCDCPSQSRKRLEIYPLERVKQSASVLRDTSPTEGNGAILQTGPLWEYINARFWGPLLSYPPGLQRWTARASPSRQKVGGSFSGESDQLKRKDLTILTLEFPLTKQSIQITLQWRSSWQAPPTHAELPNSFLVPSF